jgi:hypothetical protein
MAYISTNARVDVMDELGVVWKETGAVISETQEDP